MRSLRNPSLAAVLALCACGPKVTSIELAPAGLELSKKGEIKAFTATPQDAQKRPVENVQLAFASSDPKVATVDARGQVSAVDSGDATITATFETISATAPVKVSIPATVSFAPASARLEALGAKVNVVAKVLDGKGRETRQALSWAVEDAKVATVANGEITAVGAGETNVVVTAGAAKGTLKVAVVLPVPAVVEADKAVEIAKAGETATIKAVAKDAEGREIPAASFGYASADEKIATVDAAGVVKGVKKGKTKVTVTAGETSATVEVQVKK